MRGFVSGLFALLISTSASAQFGPQPTPGAPTNSPTFSGTVTVPAVSSPSGASGGLTTSSSIYQNANVSGSVSSNRWAQNYWNDSSWSVNTVISGSVTSIVGNGSIATLTYSGATSNFIVGQTIKIDGTNNGTISFNGNKTVLTAPSAGVVTFSSSASGTITTGTVATNAQIPAQSWWQAHIGGAGQAGSFAGGYFDNVLNSPTGDVYGVGSLPGYIGIYGTSSANVNLGGADSAFTGSISGATLTVSAVSAGTIQGGAYVSCATCVPAIIQPLDTTGTTGTGGVGNYIISTPPSQTISSTAMRATAYWGGIWAVNTQSQLNDVGVGTVTGVVGNGSSAVVTYTGTTPVEVGGSITISGTIDFNGTYDVTASTSNTATFASAVNATDGAGGAITGSTYWQSNIGYENDMTEGNGEKFFLGDVFLGVIQGSAFTTPLQELNGYRLTSSSNGVAPITCGFCIGGYNGYNPIAAAGTILKYVKHAGAVDWNPTLAYGIDLTNITFTADAYLSPGFSVDGSGNVAGNTIGSARYAGATDGGTVQLGGSSATYNDICTTPQTTGNGSQINACGLNAAISLYIRGKAANGVSFGSGGGGFALSTQTTGNPVQGSSNYWALLGTATGGTPSLTMTGIDANIGALLVTKGTGGWVFEPGTDGTAAFVIKNAAGSVSVLSADTSGNVVTTTNILDSGLTASKSLCSDASKNIISCTSSFFSAGSIANPNTTVSTTLVMAGLGSANCTSGAAACFSPVAAITPATSGRVQFTINADATIATAVAFVTVQINYGTGTAPVNGAAVTGTALCHNITLKPNATATNTPFSLTCAASGLAVGTAYWIDLAFDTNSAADAAGLVNLSVTAVEF